MFVTLYGKQIPITSIEKMKFAKDRLTQLLEIIHSNTYHTYCTKNAYELDDMLGTEYGFWSRIEIKTSIFIRIDISIKIKLKLLYIHS